jgi:putative hydrolase of the HAD superfamily
VSADLTHVDVWLFDLDNTLYPQEAGLMALVEARMAAFVMRETGLGVEEANALRHRYWREHGTTLAGLMAHHGVDPEAFLDEVHDISLDAIAPDPVLVRAIGRLPGRRLVFTNGGELHAGRVLAKLGLAGLFESVFHIRSADYIPKPEPVAFAKLIAAHAIDPAKAAFFEDSEKNLKPAAELGMTTILVGPHAEASTAPFVHHRARDLAAFLANPRVKETAQ